MKNKFVLTEEESKRILTLHKKKIQEENLIGESLINEQLDYVVNEKVSFESAEGKTDPELTIYKGAKFVPDNKGNLVATTTFNFVDTLTGQITIGFNSWTTAKDDNIKLYTFKDKVIYNCSTSKFTVPSRSTYSYYAEDSPAPELVKELRKLCEKSKSGVMTGGGGSNTTKSGCPSIVKSFTDAGYSQITLTRYKELAGNNTRIRKFKWCPVTKTNLYFAKPKVNQGGEQTGPIRGGGGQRGNRYGFNYQEAINALKSKCRTGGTGGEADDDFIDDWTSGQNQTIDTTISREDIQRWGS
jgi:hypothetical protein